jgi:hypothetical protein
MGRWAPYSYQQVSVLNCNTIFHQFAFPEDSESVISQAVFSFFGIDKEEEGAAAFIHQYPATFEPDGKQRMPCGLGILDVPLEMLAKYEDKRVKEPGWWGSEHYINSINESISKRIEAEELTAKRKEYKNSKRSKRQLNKTFKGGFGK